MTRSVICLLPDMSVEDARHYLLEHRIVTAPVVDRCHRPIGLVVFRDLLGADHDMRHHEPNTPYFTTPDGLRLPTDDGINFFALPRETVAQVMRTKFARASHRDLATSVAVMLADRSVPCVVVVDDQGLVTGIVTPEDLTLWAAGATLSRERF